MKKPLKEKSRPNSLLEFDLKMKISLLLLLCTIFSLKANKTHGQKTKISLNLVEIPLEKVIDRIENATEFRFIYLIEDVNLERKISLNVTEETLNNVLGLIFGSTETSFQIKNKRIYLLGKLPVKETTKSIIPELRVKSQSSVSGKVIDTDGVPLIGATVLEKGTTNGTTADFDGNFTIQLQGEDSVLEVSYIGYATKSVRIGSKTTITVTLEASASQLDEIVVTALGQEERKEKLSYATQRVTTDESNRSRGGDISKQLGGRVAGLNSISNGSSGGLVSSSRLTIRGENSLQLGKNEPLIVIDGVPISNNQDATGGNFRPGFGDGDLPTDFGDGLSNLNPDDIETMDVLKGANAAALYGSRAANGVIVITTKSGKGKKFGITINSGITFSDVFNTWDVQDQFGGGFNGSYDEFSGNNWGPAFDETLLIPQTGAPEFPNGSPFIKRFELEDFFQQGYSTNNNISIQGSNESSNYRFSYTDQQSEGTVPNTDFNKKSFSTKASVSLNDQFKIDFSGNYIRSFSENTPLQGFNPQSVVYPFIWGHNNFDVNWFKDYWKPGQEFVEQNWPFSWQNNPWLIANENLNSFNRNRVFGNVKLNYRPNENWVMFLRAGTDYYDDQRNARRPIGQGQFPEGMYREQNIRFQETNIDFLATYRKDLSDDFAFDTSIGANTLSVTRSSSKVEGRRLAIPGLYSLANIENQLRPDQFNSERMVHSIYGKATLGWKDALFLDITGRNDWTSTLPETNNSYFYPSAGISAVMSELFKFPENVNLWKVRANFAQVGNDTDPFIINPAKALGLVPGSVQNQGFIPISDLEPEITSSIELGTEIGLFDSRLFLEFNYYNNTTRNQIIQIPVSEASGFDAKLINAGKIRNEGMEFLLSAGIIQSTDFNWSASLNWSTNDGTIEELADGIDNFIIGSTDLNGGNIQAKVGGRIGDIYGLGYLRSPQGDIIYRNGLAQRGNETTNLGNYNPDWILGMSNTISYKFLNASILMDYRSGGELVSRTTTLLYRTGLAAETGIRPEGGIVGEGVVQGADGTFSPNTTNVSLQDYWRALKGDERNIEANIYDATYFKIREITFGIDLGHFIKSDVVKGIQLNAFMNNVFIWTKSNDLRHIDPENLSINGGTLVPGFEYTSLPATQSYGFNLTLNF